MTQPRSHSELAARSRNPDPQWAARCPPQEALSGSCGRITDPRCGLASPVRRSPFFAHTERGAPVEAMGSRGPEGRAVAGAGTFSSAPFPGALASSRSFTQGAWSLTRGAAGVSAVREMNTAGEEADRHPALTRFPKEPEIMCSSCPSSLVREMSRLWLLLSLSRNPHRSPPPTPRHRSQAPSLLGGGIPGLGVEGAEVQLQFSAASAVHCSWSH